MSRTISNALTFTLEESEEEREKGEILLEEIIAENFPNLGKNRHPGPGITESPK